MPRPFYTIILPAPDWTQAQPALCSISSSTYPAERFEIIVTLGRNPSAQRNAAAAEAHGEILVFLDSDCRVSPDYWRQLEEALQATQGDVVGGPVLLQTPAAFWPQVFHTLLSSPRLLGPLASRYAARGERRRGHENELILCNLAVRTAAWKKVGPFRETLYPNEENEWMDRAETQGCSLWHEPDLTVTRPQRPHLLAFFWMLGRYGCGRTQQSWQSKSWAPARQVLPLVLLLGLCCLIQAPVVTSVLGLLVWMGLGLSVARDQPRHLLLSIILLAGSVPLFYAIGQWWGLSQILFHRSSTSSGSVTLHQPDGTPLIPSSPLALPSPETE